MSQNLTQSKVSKLFSPWMLILCVIGLLLNIVLSKIVVYFGLPLYMDNVGSILTAALGGALPGMAVGFLSKWSSSISEPISMYYGILVIVMACIAALFSKRGMFKNWKGWIAASGCFVLIGGAIGSIMTWFLYGGCIIGIATPYATYLFNHGFSEFWAQFTADVILDIPDKLITVGIVCLILRFYPKCLYNKFPLSSIYDGTPERENINENKEKREQIKHSVNNRVVTILMSCIAIISLMAVTVGTVYHHQRLVGSYEDSATMISRQAAACVDGDLVQTYIDQGETNPQYNEVLDQFNKMYERTENIAYLYVYSFREDGTYVVFDVNTPAAKADAPGTILKTEDSMEVNGDELLAGGNIEPVYTDGEYGKCITAFTPIYNSAGETVAYACADVGMEEYAIDLMTYVIQVLSVLFAISLLIVIFALWYINRHITTPIRMIVDQTQALDEISPENWLTSQAWMSRVPVETGDELEELYKTVYKVEENASLNVRKVIESEQQLRESKELERINGELALAIKKADEANLAKTEFLSRMSHDIRTPLNAILGTVALAKDELDDAKATEENLETIASSGRFLHGLINDILDINKIESGKLDLRPETYTVGEFTSSIESGFNPLMEKKNLNFVFKMNSGYSTICVDKLRYNQIFFNLLSNAVKYTPEGGTIEFITVPLDAPEGIAGIRTIVRDNGIGMSEDYMAHLFEPFTRDSNAEINQTEGSGLGLAIVKNIVDAMDGTISVTSQLGQGSEFVVDLYLPLAKKKDIVAEKVSHYDEKSLNEKKILLVDDNKTNIYIAMKLLEKKGCKVTVAHNGLEAVNMYESQGRESFDLILMDIRMPILNGIDATKRIRLMEKETNMRIPIIAMTADAFSDDISRTLEAGMDAHIAKPIEPKLLYETIADWL